MKPTPFFQRLQGQLYLPRYTLEIAVSTPEEALSAAANGADRLELSSGLELGGLTPSLHTFLAVQESVAIPLYVLIRPRPGGFHYSDRDFAVMCRDADEFLKRGASGIVFGILNSQRIDVARCGKLVELAAGRAVFHRAFDGLDDPLAALDQLAELGFERLLTSGQGTTAAEGTSQLAALVQRAGSRIEILPAGNIRPDNVSELIHKTRCRQVHSSARSMAALSSDKFQELAAMSTNPAVVADLRRELDRMASELEEGFPALNANVSEPTVT